MIEITKDELQAVLNTLYELKFKEVAGLVQFFNEKIKSHNTDQKD
jgi:hypothetical protein